MRQIDSIFQRNTVGPVLIVDDEPEWRNILSAILNESRIEHKAVGTIKAAKAEVIIIHPTVLLIDLKFGGHWDGWELARLAQEHDISSVIISGYAKSNDISRRAFRDFKAIDVIDKGDFWNQRQEFLDAVFEADRASRRLRKLTHVRTDVSLLVRFRTLPNQGVFSFVNSLVHGDFVFEEFTPPMPVESMTTISPLLEMEDDKDFMDSLARGIPIFLSELSFRTREELLAGLGVTLFDALAHGNVGTAIQDVLFRTIKDKSETSLRISFDERSAKYLGYPWELVHDSRRFLVKSGLGVTRSLYLAEPGNAVEITAPVHVLSVSPRPVDASRIPRRDIKRVKQGLSSEQPEHEFVFSTIRSPATFRKLRDKLNRLRREHKPVHILLIDGHGFVGWKCEACLQINSDAQKTCENADCQRPRGGQVSSGYILFEEEDGTSDKVSADEFATWTGRSGVQLVVLNACESGKLDGKDVYGAVSVALIREHIPAVIALQFPIRAKEMESFLVELFTSMASTLTKQTQIGLADIERSMIHARSALSKQYWFYPVLYAQGSNWTFIR